MKYDKNQLLHNYQSFPLGKDNIHIYVAKGKRFVYNGRRQRKASLDSYKFCQEYETS